MNISRAKEEIKNTVRAYLAKDEEGRPLIPAVRQRPVLLIGPPGIGKTAIMEQAARECGIGLAAYTMTHHTRQSAMGLPFIDKKIYDGKEVSVTSYTMSEIISSVHDKIEKTGIREGILFIDEINCVSETLAPVMLQFLQAKMFGNTRVPDGWIIVAAGNPPEYNRSVREFDVVTLDRVKYIEVTPDYSAWKTYAQKNDVHRAILSYLDARQENFYKIETTVEGKRFVTARGWEDLSDMLKAYERLGIPADEQLAGEYIQEPETAMDFANYLSLYYKYEKAYSVSDILGGNAAEQVYERIKNAPFDERVSVVSLILGGLNNLFKKYYRCTQTAQELFDELKAFQRDEAKSFDEVVRGFAADFVEKREGGFLDDEQLAVKSQVMKLLNSYTLAVKEQGALGHAEQFAVVSAEFMKLSDERERLSEEVSQALEHAFDFGERAFGQGPELVFFVTELAAGFYSLSFIQENGNERFYRYNKSMLRDTARERLISEL